MAGGGRETHTEIARFIAKFNASFLLLSFNLHTVHTLLLLFRSWLHTLFLSPFVLPLSNNRSCQLSCFAVVFLLVSVLRHRCKSRYMFVNFVLLFLLLINFCTFSQLKCNSIKVFSDFLLGSFFRIHTHSQVSTRTRTHTRRNTTRITSKQAVVVVALTVTCE